MRHLAQILILTALGSQFAQFNGEKPGLLTTLATSAPSTEASSRPISLPVNCQTPEEVDKYVNSLPAWSRELSQDDWDYYIRCANMLQLTEYETIAEGLRIFDKRADARNDKRRYGGFVESKPFLLMRIMFDLPESAPKGDRLLFTGWYHASPAKDGKVNMSWPVDWSSGRPRLICDMPWTAGPIIYFARREFEYFLMKYRHRSLAKYVATSRAAP